MPNNYIASLICAAVLLPLSSAASAERRDILNWNFVQGSFIADSKTSVNDADDINGDGYSFEAQKTFGSKFMARVQYTDNTVEDVDVDVSLLSIGLGIIPEDDGIKQRGFFFVGSFEQLDFSGNGIGAPNITEDGWGIGTGWRQLFWKRRAEFEARIRYIDVDETDGIIASASLMGHITRNLGLIVKFENRHLIDDSDPANKIEFDERLTSVGLRYNFGGDE